MGRGGPVILGFVVLSACSSDGWQASIETEPPVATPFRTLAPTTTESPPTTTDPNAPTTPPRTDSAGSVITTVPGGTLPPADVCVPGRYEIQESDTSRLRVANKFDLSIEELDAANEDTEGYAAFYVGLDIVIPCPRVPATVPGPVPGSAPGTVPEPT